MMDDCIDLIQGNQLRAKSVRYLLVTVEIPGFEPELCNDVEKCVVVVQNHVFVVWPNSVRRIYVKEFGFRIRNGLNCLIAGCACIKNFR